MDFLNGIFNPLLNGYIAVRQIDAQQAAANAAIRASEANRAKVDDQSKFELAILAGLVFTVIAGVVIVKASKG